MIAAHPRRDEFAVPHGNQALGIAAIEPAASIDAQRAIANGLYRTEGASEIRRHADERVVATIS